MPQIVKNEASATKRLASPISVFDADGNYVDTTFHHATAVTGVTGVAKEVEIWNGTTLAWVEASSDAIQDGTSSGVYRYQFSMAETNFTDRRIAVRLTKSDGKPTYYYAEQVTTDLETLESESSSGLTTVTTAISTLQSSVDGIQNNTTCVRSVPSRLIAPTAGSRTYRIELLLYDENGNMEVPDAAPTIALVNQTGTDRSGRLDSTTMANISAGRYRAIYTSTTGDSEEQLNWTFSVTEGAVVRVWTNTSSVEPESEASGTVDVNVIKWLGTSVPAPTVAGIPRVELASAMTDAISAAALSAAAAAKQGVAVWAQIQEGSITYGDGMRSILSGVLGRVTDFTTGVLEWLSADGTKVRWRTKSSRVGRYFSAQGDSTP